MRLQHSVPWLVVSALFASAIIVLGAAYVARSNIERANELSETVIHGGDVLDALNRLQLAMLGRDRPRARDRLADLRRLEREGGRPMPRLAALEKLVEEGPDDAAALLPVLEELRAEEMRERVTYKDLMRRQNAASEFTEFGATAVVLSQIALCYFLLLRYSRQRREGELALARLNDRLEDTVHERTQELRDLSRYLMNVREEEKARIARELHDEMGSTLTAVNMDLAWARKALPEGSPVAARLSRASATLRSTVEAMRRVIEDLRPTMLESLGLQEALRSLAEDTAARSGVPVAVELPPELPPLRGGVAIGLFRIVQEALTNASRYAKASSIAVSLRLAGRELVLSVEDNGVGLPATVPGEKRKSHGLLGIRERATALGGTATIGAGAGGRGTAVRVVTPIAAPPAAAA